MPPNRSRCLKWRHHCHRKANVEGRRKYEWCCRFHSCGYHECSISEHATGRTAGTWLLILRKLVEVGERTKLCPKIDHAHCGHPPLTFGTFRNLFLSPQNHSRLQQAKKNSSGTLGLGGNTVSYQLLSGVLEPQQMNRPLEN